MMRHLMTEKNFLTDAEFKKFEPFALALDSAIVNRYHGLLEELKVNYELHCEYIQQLMVLKCIRDTRGVKQMFTIFEAN